VVHYLDDSKNDFYQLTRVNVRGEDLATKSANRDFAPVIEVAHRWINRSVINDKSLFTDETIWTLQNLSEVKSIFTDNPDEGQDNFSTKLVNQFMSASATSCKLMAELLYIHLLFPRKITSAKKRKQVIEIWNLSGELLAETHSLLSDDILFGIGNAGTAYNTLRWKEVNFLIESIMSLKTLARSDREIALTDYDAFIHWVSTVNQAGSRQFPNMLRYFCFPDIVERITSKNDQFEILVGFNVGSLRDVSRWDTKRLDTGLLELRRKLEDEHPGRIFDFYDEGFVELWRRESARPRSSAIANASPALNLTLNSLSNDLHDGITASGMVVDKHVINRLVASLLSKRFLILTGLSGSGKTRVAQMFAYWLCEPISTTDVLAPGGHVNSETITYYINKSDSVGVEFWNSQDESQAVKVVLPREIIQEWADYIVNNKVPRTVQAREIREAVKPTSKFSGQLHSYETHLKAAAFALIEHAKSVPNAPAYSIVPVGADWTDNTSILGYADGIDYQRYSSTPIIEMLMQAASNPQKPHLLILDEMNMSHVERYFADFLSCMESGESIHLYSGDLANQSTWRKSQTGRIIPPCIASIPANLFIVGTVNIDETTYMFSPKVLDRAHVIEFRVSQSEMNRYLTSPKRPDLKRIQSAGSPYGHEFVKHANSEVTLSDEYMKLVREEFGFFFASLSTVGAEFGFRTAHEIVRFVNFYIELSDITETSINEPIDFVVLQKLLPKLHGSRTKLAPVLKQLWYLCITPIEKRELNHDDGTMPRSSQSSSQADPSSAIPANAPYPASAEKIARMWKLLHANGFTSFAEA
jgi:hypothetical protein